MPNPLHRLQLAGHVVIASFAVTHSLVAQEDQRPPNAAQTTSARDSLPFRAGQWGAEFAIDDGTVGLGVLRFRSPRQAWLLDASFSADWYDEESVFGSGTRTSVFVRGRTGPRRYRPIHTASAGYVGIGLTGAYARSGRGDDYSRLWDAGIFGELGGLYLVTPHLSLGAEVGLSVLYSERRIRVIGAGPDQWERGVGVDVGSVRIVGALYF
jgi:hypothetical protein